MTSRFPEISVRFTLGGEFDPAQITKLTGIPPTRTWRVGESLPPIRAGRTRRNDGWQLSRTATAALDLWAVLEPLVREVEGAAEELRQARADFDLWAEFGCSTYITDQAPAVSLPATALERIARLKADFDLDIYQFPSEDEGEGLEGVGDQEEARDG